MENNKAQAKEDLKDVEEHAQMVESVFHVLRCIAIDLNDDNLNHTRKEGGISIKACFLYLETREGAKQYLQTFGPFYRAYNHLKARYEKEVLNFTETNNQQPTTDNR